MKQQFVLLALLLALATSCSEDFLVKTPQDSLTDSDFYKTESDFRQALNATYQAIRTGITSRESWMMGEMRSDNTHYDYNPTLRGEYIVGSENIADFTDNSQNQLTNEKYYQCYTGISRANTIIARMTSAGLATDVSNAILGEAKFLRALLYFDLVQYYGDVPLYQGEIESQLEAYLPRSPKADVYKLILADVNEAVSKLPAPAFPQSGRATKGSAKILLAHVSMVQKDYATAEKALKDLTGLGYLLLPDYASVFELANKNSKESIFEAQYQQGNQGQQSDFVYYFIPATDNTAPITGVESSNYAFNSLTGGRNIPTPEMISTYEPGDKRLGASIGIAEGTGPTNGFKAETIKSVISYVTPSVKTAKPFIKKYLHAHSLVRNTDDNWPIYRYADALLFLAEALNEQGKGAEAISYLNQVRKRAGLADFTNSSQITLRDVIAHERRVELAFENKRWLDLVRTGKAVEVMTANGKYLKSIYPYLQANTYNITPDRLLFPIPQREIIIGNLTQNPGYQ